MMRNTTINLARQTPGITLSMLFVFLAGQSAPVLASPPPWAPAHGYYKDKGKDRHHYEEHEYRYAPAPVSSGYVIDGRCNREGIGRVLGGVVGGVAGSRIGKGDARVVATIAGTLVGAMVGGAMGRSMDDADVACIGEALEYGQDNQRVNWTNPDTGGQYSLMPTNSYRQGESYCREFTRDAVIGGRRETLTGTACRQPDGSWHM